MSSARLIKRRIKSAKNISQITKAMEMVAASKMKRSQEQALASRPYAERLEETLRSIATRTPSATHPLLQTFESDTVLVVLFSSDRGLSGSLNTNLFKATLRFSQDHKQLKFIAIGKKAKELVLKSGFELLAEFTNIPDHLRFEHTLPISELVMREFLRGVYGAAYTIHMKFLTTLSQKVQIRALLPLSYATERPEKLLATTKEYTFEPSPTEILEFLLPYYVETLIYQTVLDSKASEQSARMVAMKNASDNAKEVVAGLQLQYNKSRQASITSELIDMTTAALSIA